MASASPSNTEPAIELVDVEKRFGARRVLGGVTLRVPRGGRLGIIGPATAGKSVMVKIIAGLLRPEAGLVRVAGPVGMLFQNCALFDFMSVADNVAFPLVQEGTLPEDEIAARVAARLRAVGLAGSERKVPAELSGGMKKRVGLARATVARPAVALYDEPTAGLDPVTTAKIYQLLRDDHDAGGGTAVVVSSDVDAVAGFADTIAFVDGGGVRWVGPAAGLHDAADDAVRGFARGTP